MSRIAGSESRAMVKLHGCQWTLIQFFFFDLGQRRALGMLDDLTTTHCVSPQLNKSPNLEISRSLVAEKYQIIPNIKCHHSRERWVGVDRQNPEGSLWKGPSWKKHIRIPNHQLFPAQPTAPTTCSEVKWICHPVMAESIGIPHAYK